MYRSARLGSAQRPSVASTYPASGARSTPETSPTSHPLPYHPSTSDIITYGIRVRKYTTLCTHSVSSPALRPAYKQDAVARTNRSTSSAPAQFEVRSVIKPGRRTRPGLMPANARRHRSQCPQRNVRSHAAATAPAAPTDAEYAAQDRPTSAFDAGALLGPVPASAAGRRASTCSSSSG
jgi:hypothetical protein